MKYAEVAPVAYIIFQYVGPRKQSVKIWPPATRCFGCFELRQCCSLTVCLGSLLLRNGFLVSEGAHGTLGDPRVL